MKKVLGFIKSNLLIVVPMVVAILAIPAMLYFALGWNASIRDEVTGDVSKTMSSLNSLQVTYEIPALSPDDEPWSHRSVPNPVLNERVEAVLKRLTEQSERVRDLAVERNGRGKALLIDGAGARERLFPRPADESARVKLLTDFAALWPEAHVDLLSRLKAGSPPDADIVRRRLEASQARLRDDRVRNRAEQELTEEEQREIAKILADERLGLYRDAASEITVYADPSVFRRVAPWPESAGVPSIEQAWRWQHLYWVHEDILEAIRVANSTPGVPWLPVPSAPVKRIVSIDVDEFGAASVDPRAAAAAAAATGGRGGRGGGDGGGARALPTDPNQPIAPDFSVSFTGRGGWPDLPNAFYDVRYATVELVVDVARMPAILNAFSTTNFMTVIGVEIETLPPGAHHAEGFAYGGGQLARVTLELETIWIRQWMKKWMPEGVREQLGIPPEPEEDETGDEA